MPKKPQLTTLTRSAVRMAERQGRPALPVARDYREIIALQMALDETEAAIEALLQASTKKQIAAAWTQMKRARRLSARAWKIRITNANIRRQTV